MRVRSDPEALAELATTLRAFRTAMDEGESALRDRLLFGLHESWSDARYDEFREPLLGNLDVLRSASETQLAELEQRLYVLRERLLRYHEESLVRRETTLPAASSMGRTLASAEIAVQRAAYEHGKRTVGLRVGKCNVPTQINVAAISPPQNEPDFTWKHHGYDKASYLELAATLAEITPLLQQGHSHDDLAKHDRYRRAIEAFWSRDDPIRVTRFRDIYLVEAGRHRVAAVLERGGSQLLEALVTEEMVNE